MNEYDHLKAQIVKQKTTIYIYGHSKDTAIQYAISDTGFAPDY